MRKFLFSIAAASGILSSCATPKHMTDYTVNNIPVEIIDNQEYFIQRDAEGKIITLTPKVDEQKKDKKMTALIATTGVTAGLSFLSLFIALSATIRR